jgi:hypothetical protein
VAANPTVDRQSKRDVSTCISETVGHSVQGVLAISTGTIAGPFEGWLDLSF